MGPRVVSYQRWKDHGFGKITDFDKIPKEWDWTDYDIHEEFAYEI